MLPPRPLPRPATVEPLPKKDRVARRDLSTSPASLVDSSAETAVDVEARSTWNRVRGALKARRASYAAFVPSARRARRPRPRSNREGPSRCTDRRRPETTCRQPQRSPGTAPGGRLARTACHRARGVPRSPRSREGALRSAPPATTGCRTSSRSHRDPRESAGGPRTPLRETRRGPSTTDPRVGSIADRSDSAETQRNRSHRATVDTAALTLPPVGPATAQPR